ncbi:SDR family NAD(P)-dependent oxidoreductase [Undibacter mobilis]|nr:SDR family NAD(P)-dependent oxidoreductase [Undibacter mobilis]
MTASDHSQQPIHGVLPLNDMFSLKGKSAFVTGAGSGLGRVIAEGYAQAGARVICADIFEDRIAEVVQAIVSNGGAAEPCKIDVASEASVEAAFAGLNHPHLHVLVNSAGVAAVPARTHETRTEDWRRVIDINLTGTFFVTRAALPKMFDEGGSIINLSSIMGLGGYYPGFTSSGVDYAASKSAIVGFTKQVAVEYAEYNIRANTIAPGWHGGTRLGQARRKQAAAAEEERFYAAIHSRIPMKRRGDASEILGVALYLASPASGYMTGQLLVQDGGWTAT